MDELLEKKEDELILKITDEVTKNRSKIRADFARAYLAHLPEGTTFDDIQLVETYKDNQWKYWFECKVEGRWPDSPSEEEIAEAQKEKENDEL